MGEEPIPVDFRLLPPVPSWGRSGDLPSVFADWESASLDQTIRSRARLVGRQEAEAAREERLELRRIDVAFQIKTKYLDALKEVWLKQIDLQIKTLEQETDRLKTRQDFKDRRNARRAESTLLKIKGRVERDRLRLVQPHEIDRLMAQEQTEVRKVVVALNHELRANPALKERLQPVLQDMLDFDAFMKQLRERFSDPDTGQVDEERLRPLDERMTTMFEEIIRKPRG